MQVAPLENLVDRIYGIPDFLLVCRRPGSDNVLSKAWALVRVTENGRALRPAVCRMPKLN